MKSKKSVSISALLVLSSLFVDCVNHDIRATISGDYFVFGSYYGMCAGNCVNVFVIKDGMLYKAKNQTYPNRQHDYYLSDLIELDQTKYDLVKELPQKVPAELLDESQTVIGCPDCADGGGLYIEVRVQGEKKYWYLDNSKYQTPSYLHGFIDEVNAKIALLRN